MKFLSLIAVAPLLILAGCQTTPKATKPDPTSLELQAFQKQTLDCSKKVAFASTMSVFQDLGYTIQSADLDTGFITVSSPTSGSGDELSNVEPVLKGLALCLGILGGNCTIAGSSPSSVATQVTKVTAFIEDLNEAKTSIRLNFVRCKQTSSGYGQVHNQDTPVTDPLVYQNAFTKIQEAVFIRQGIVAVPSSSPSTDDSPETNLAS